MPAKSDNGRGSSSQSKNGTAGELVNAESRGPGGIYSEAEIELGLHVMALCSGSARRASRELARRGKPIPRATLQKWKAETHADRYRAICRDTLPVVYEQVAEESEGLARDYMRAERKVLRRFNKTLDELKPADAASAVRNLATARGISTDKARVIRGQPTEIRETRDLASSLRALTKRFPAVVHVEGDYIDAPAEELPSDEKPPDQAA